MKINAKHELVEQLEYGFTIKCASFEYYDSAKDETTKFILKIGYNSLEFRTFMNLLDFDYENEDDKCVIIGVVWFEDGGYLDRQFYPIHEYWVHNPIPKLPTECY